MIVCRLLARIVSVLTLTAAVAGAQTPAPQPAPTPVKPKSAKPPATAGVEFGLALARVGPALEGESTERRPGAQFGIYGSVPWLKTVSLQGDLTFIQRHSRITSAAGQTSNIDIDYLEIPVLVRMVGFMRKGRELFYMTEGPAFSFPLRARYQPVGNPALDVKSNTPSPDIGMLIGIGTWMGKNAIEFQYNGGLKKVDTFGLDAHRSRTISFLLRRKF